MRTNPALMSPERSRRHGGLGFQPGTWWLNTLFAFRDGIIDLESTDGGVCGDSNCAYAIVLKDTDEIESAVPTAFTYRCRANDTRRFRLISADSKSRYPVRVLRSHCLTSLWAPRAGVRYDGLHRVTGWIVRPVRASDTFNSDHKLGDLIFEIKFEREDAGQVSMEQVMMHPLASEIDDYAEYKRLRSLQRQKRHHKEPSPQNTSELRKEEMGIDTTSTAVFSPAPSTTSEPSHMASASAFRTPGSAKDGFPGLSSKGTLMEGSTGSRQPSHPSTFVEKPPPAISQPHFPSIASSPLHPGIPIPSRGSPAAIVTGAGMLEVPALSRSPTNVSQHSFREGSQHGGGTLQTPDSAHSFITATSVNRSPSIRDTLDKSYTIKDVAPWVDCDSDVPGRSFSGSNTIHDVAPWANYGFDKTASRPRSPMPLSPGDVGQGTATFSGKGSVSGKHNSPGNPKVGTVGPLLVPEPWKAQQVKRSTTQRRKHVDREEKEEEREQGGLLSRSRGNLARSRNPLAKLFDGAVDGGFCAEHTIEPQLEGNPPSPLTPAQLRLSPPTTPCRPTSALSKPATALATGSSSDAFPYGFTPLRMPVEPLTDTQWMQLLHLSQQIQRLPADLSHRLLPLPISAAHSSPEAHASASPLAPKLLAPPNTPVTTWKLRGPPGPAVDCCADSPVSARHAAPQAMKAVVAARAMEALVAFQGDGGAGSEAGGFGDPFGNVEERTSVGVDPMSLEGEVEEESEDGRDEVGVVE